jgi:hypothetical protein
MRNLKKHLRGRKSILIWDGFPKIVEFAELSGVSGVQAFRYANIVPLAERPKKTVHSSLSDIPKNAHVGDV